MSETNPKDTNRILNGILALGMLLILGAVAGLAATAVTGASVKPASPARSMEGSGLHPERIRGKYGYVDASGKVVIPPSFDGADAFSEGLAVVLCSGRFGYIDQKGAFAIPAVYRHARAFRDGYAPVRSEEAWLTIDRGGKPVMASMAAEP